MRRFDACALCLQRARDPVACQKGHLFCRECVLTDLGAFPPSLRLGEGVCTRFCVSFGLGRATELTRLGIWISVGQIGDIKRQKVRLEVLKKEAEEERQRAREAARERVLLEFEKGQLGLAATSTISTSSSIDSSECTSIFFSFFFSPSLLNHPWFTPSRHSPGDEAQVRLRRERGGDPCPGGRRGRAPSDRA